MYKRKKSRATNCKVAVGCDSRQLILRTLECFNFNTWLDFENLDTCTSIFEI